MTDLVSDGRSMAEPRLRRTACLYCGASVLIRKDGRLRRHAKTVRYGPVKVRIKCRGGGEKPSVVRRRVVLLEEGEAAEKA